MQNRLACDWCQENVTFSCENPDLFHTIWKWPPCFFRDVFSLRTRMFVFPLFQISVQFLFHVKPQEIVVENVWTNDNLCSFVFDVHQTETSQLLCHSRSWSMQKYHAYLMIPIRTTHFYQVLLLVLYTYFILASKQSWYTSVIPILRWGEGTEAKLSNFSRDMEWEIEKKNSIWTQSTYFFSLHTQFQHDIFPESSNDSW